MFSASIPEKVFFKEFETKYYNNKPNVSTKWVNLPTDHPRQVRQELSSILDGIDPMKRKREVFSSDDPKVTKYKLKDGYVPVDNQPMRLWLVGYSSVSRPYDYKKFEIVVTDENGYTFPIGHDVFMNAVLGTGLGSDGQLPGEYIFVRFTKHIRVVQVGSELYKAVVDHISEKKKSKIKIRDMQVGETYYTGAGNVALFLGFVNTKSMIVDIPADVERFFWSKKHTASDPLQNFGVRFRDKTLVSLWMEFGNKNEGFEATTEEIFSQLTKALYNQHYYRFVVKQQHRYNNTYLDKKVDVPTDVILRIRRLMNAKVKKVVEQDRRYRATPGIFTKASIARRSPSASKDMLRHFDAFRVANYSQTLNMVPYGMQPIISDVCKMFEHWFQRKNIFKE